MSLPKFTIPAEKHQIKMLNEALRLLRETHNAYKKRKFNLLTIFSHLEPKTAYYEGKVYLKFFDFIDRAIKNTTPGFIFGPKVTTRSDLRNILLNIVLAIRSIRSEQSTELKDFIRDQFGYKISESDTLNLLNFFLNFKSYDTFDTVKLIKQISPDMLEDLRTDDIHKMKVQLKGGRKTRRATRRKSQTRKH